MTTTADAVKANETPDPEHVTQDPFGRGAFYRFTCSYDHEGREFGFELWATSFADAQRRLESLKRTARLDGQIYRTIPARNVNKAIN